MKRRPFTITLPDDLDRAMACEEQADLALMHFGPGMHRVTADRLREATALGLNVNWLVQLLPAWVQDAYYVAEHPLWDAYVAEPSLWDAYIVARAETLAAILDQEAP